VDAAQSEVELSNGYVGEPLDVILTLRDAMGNALEGQTAELSLSIGGANSTIVADSVEELGDGAYRLVYTPLYSGTDQLTILYGGESFKDSPYSIRILSLEPASILLTKGDAQEGLILQSLEEFLEVQVFDSRGVGLGKVPVEFSIQSAPADAQGAVIARSELLTTQNGKARTNFTLGSKRGTYLVQARVAGLDPVVFTLQAQTPPVVFDEQDPNYQGPYRYQITVSDPNPAVNSILTLVGQLRDRHGNALAVEGLKATWAKTSPFGSLSATESMTDDQGRVYTSYSVGDVAGSTHLISLQTDLQGQPDSAGEPLRIYGETSPIRVKGGSIGALELTGPDSVNVGELSDLFTITLVDTLGGRVAAPENLAFRLDIENVQNLRLYQLKEGGLQEVDRPRLEIAKGEVSIRFALQQERSGLREFRPVQVLGLLQVPTDSAALYFQSGSVKLFEISQGSDQQGPVLTQLEQSLIVLATDQYGNPIPESRIRFTLEETPLQAQDAGFAPAVGTAVGAPAGGNGLAESIEILTNAEGQAGVDFTIGDIAGLYRVVATIPAVESVAALEFALEGLPDRFALEQNYPNPFGGRTTIPLQVPAVSQVTMEVFDVIGGRVKLLLDKERLEVGRHLIAFDASDLASDVYMVRVIAESEDGRTFVEYITLTVMNR
jgi:hypothetical protein